MEFKIIDDEEGAAVGVNQAMPLVPLDPFFRHRNLAACPLATGHDESVVDRHEDARVTPSREPAIDRAPQRKIGGQEAPCKARSLALALPPSHITRWGTTLETAHAIDYRSWPATDEKLVISLP